MLDAINQEVRNIFPANKFQNKGDPLIIMHIELYSGKCSCESV